MSEYWSPSEAIGRTLGAAGIDELLALAAFRDVSRDDVDSVLDGFGRFASEVIAPTDRIGDVWGNEFDPTSGLVTTPDPVRSAFQQWSKDGWSGMAMPAEYGGGGLPSVVGLAAEEMFASANLALSLNPMLSQGAMHLLAEWGNEDQQNRFLGPLVEGAWTGTMNLTEPDAGSDVGAIRTQAALREDGCWELTGTKIFVTWGEHDLAENIVHLVLARTPGAPPGTRGISLFVVPSHHVAGDGNVGERNNVRCTGLERKMGIHASPTCVLDFEGAVGELIGHECGGMAAMFTMMNAARLSVGLEGLAVSERAYQQAHLYAQQRRQGRAPGALGDEPSPIVDHPDVRRMLMTMTTGIDAMRVLLYTTAIAADFARHSTNTEQRETMRTRADLLTPLAKAWCTDEGVRLTSLAVQVHGGAGYIEETGIAQRFRDSRIAPIYEGTNGIQAIDLASRKIRRDGGAGMASLLNELSSSACSLRGMKGMGEPTHLLKEAMAALAKATRWMVDVERDEDWLSGATPYLELASLTVCGGLLADQLSWASSHLPSDDADLLAGRLRFFALERLAFAPAYLAAITGGADRLDHSLLA